MRSKDLATVLEIVEKLSADERQALLKFLSEEPIKHRFIFTGGEPETRTIRCTVEEPTEPEKFYTVEETAAMTGYARSTLWEKLQAGKLRGRHFGARWFVPASEVTRLKESRFIRW